MDYEVDYGVDYGVDKGVDYGVDNEVDYGVDNGADYICNICLHISTPTSSIYFYTNMPYMYTYNFIHIILLCSKYPMEHMI